MAKDVSGQSARRHSTAGLTSTALELADERGLDAVTLSELARHVGVKVPSLYTHVRSLADLRARMAGRALEELADRGGEAIAGRSGGEALRALSNAFRDYAHEHPGRWDAAQLRRPPAEVTTDAAPRMAAHLAAVLRGYAVPPEDHLHAIRLIAATQNGWIELELDGGFDRADAGVEVSWEHALSALDRALRTWGERHRSPGS